MYCHSALTNHIFNPTRRDQSTPLEVVRQLLYVLRPLRHSPGLLAAGAPEMSDRYVG